MDNASTWYAADVTEIRQESPTARTLRLRLPHPVEHLPGQHYEIRLTAPDGYQAARLYSAASAADGSDNLELTIALVQDGEVSPYLTNSLTVGSHAEVRGPLGKFFVWDAATAGPTLLVAGGSGVAPMRAILQAHATSNSATPLRLLYSARSHDEIFYKDYLLHNDRVGITITGEASADWRGHSGRINKTLLATTLKDLGTATPDCFVCGMTPFVEAMTQLLVEAGIPAGKIKAERYGSA